MSAEFTPEMLAAAYVTLARLYHGEGGHISEGAAHEQALVTYRAMKALDPEIERLRVALDELLEGLRIVQQGLPERQTKRIKFAEQLMTKYGLSEPFGPAASSFNPISQEGGQ